MAGTEAKGDSRTRARLGSRQRQVEGHGGPERLAEDHEPLRRDALLLDQPPVRGAGVAVGALLVGRALAPPVAPVVEEEHGGPELRLQEEGAIEAVADVAPVAVGKEHGPVRLAPGRQVPGVDPVTPSSAVSVTLLEGEAQVARSRRPACRWREVDQLPLEDQHDGREHDEEAGDAEGGPGGPPPPWPLLARSHSRRTSAAILYPTLQGLQRCASRSISIMNSGSARPLTSSQVPVGNCFL